jgi:hypothetical protein
VDQHHPKTVTVGNPSTVAPEGMRLASHREQAFDGSPDGIEHLRFERAHDDRVPPLGRVWDSTSTVSLATTTTGGWSCALNGNCLTRRPDDSYAAAS